MSDSKNRSRVIVLLAIAVVVLLGATLGSRFLAKDKPVPSEPPVVRLARCTVSPSVARVAAPKKIEALKVPSWGSSVSDPWPIRFQTDLDLLAPLGDGAANAALWLKDFTP